MAAVVLNGCVVKRETNITPQTAESFVLQHLVPKPEAVDCPGASKVKQGGTFDCSVAYPNGRRGTLTLHMIDDAGAVRFGPEDLRMQG